jgi:translation initiation factor IF-3
VLLFCRRQRLTARLFQGGRHISRDARTNRRIRATEVRVLGATGEQLGVLPIHQALALAQEQGLDLVEISPMAKPPVCKIMDYGKYKYEMKKKAAESRKKQVVVHIKEIKLRPKTEEHDYDFKVRNVKRFLENGDKSKVTIVFRGREMAHRELGQKILERVIKDVKDMGIIEQAPRLEGRQLSVLLAPNPKWKPPKPSAQPQPAKPAVQPSAVSGKPTPLASGPAPAAVRAQVEPAPAAAPAKI